MNGKTTQNPDAAVAVHSSLTVSSESHAASLFSNLFGMPVVKAFEASDEVCQGLFGMSGPVKIIVYKAGTMAVEVFIHPKTAGRAGIFDHLCLAVPDRLSVIRSAQAMGLEVNRVSKDSKETVFLRDWDGNLYEIKEGQG